MVHTNVHVTVEVWSLLVGVSLSAGAIHWVLQRTRRRLLQGSEAAEMRDPTGKSYASALFYTSGLLLQNPPSKLPRNFTGQVVFIQVLMFLPCERAHRTQWCWCSCYAVIESSHTLGIIVVVELEVPLRGLTRMVI